MLGDDGEVASVKVSDGLWTKRLRAEKVERRLDDIENGLVDRIKMLEDMVEQLRGQNENLLYEVQRRPTQRQLHDSERRAEILDDKLKRATRERKQRKAGVSSRQDIFMRQTVHKMGGLEKLRESIRRAPPKPDTVRGLLAASGGAQAHDLDIEHACRILVLKSCVELGVDSPLDLVPTVKVLQRKAAVQSQEELFIERVCGALSRMVDTASRRSGEPERPEENVSKLASERANANLPRSLTLKQALQALARVERYVVAMKELQRSPTTYAHELILQFQRFAGSSAVSEIPQNMQKIEDRMVDMRAFVTELRALLELDASASLDDTISILKGYVRAFGLPREAAPFDRKLVVNYGKCKRYR